MSTKGHETVFVVEDEPLVRKMALRILRGLGYVVVEAADSAEAARRLDDLGGRIDLLVTDIIMPGGSGRELAELFRRGKPDLKVLFTSGYSENATSRHGVVDAGVHFLPKPYGPTELAAAVREVLDER